MYGLVNRAIQQLVVSQAGELGWRRVCEQAGVGDEGFLAVEAYPDDLTYRLVAAVSAELGISAEQTLEAFGEYWILYTAEEGYAEVLQAGGANLREFLGNLNDMHARIETVYPRMVVPEFDVEDAGPGAFRLHYRSHREGLAPMVVGLLKGLGRRFGQSLVIEHEVRRHEAGHDVFRVQAGPAGGEPVA